MFKKIVIFGTEDLASLANFYLRNDSQYEPCAFCVDSDFLKENKFEEMPLVSVEEVDKFFSPDEYGFFVPLYDNKLREKKSEQIKNKGYELISYISSKATVFPDVGENCFIMENNVIQPFVKLGNNIVMWSGNHVGHHSVICDNVFFSSHVVVSGHVTINSYCWFGVNCSIKDHLMIAEGTFVAMSSMVVKNTKPYTKYIGNPAKEYGKIHI